MEYFAEMILIIHLMCVVNFFLIHLKNLFGFKENIPVDLENKTRESEMINQTRGKGPCKLKNIFKSCSVIKMHILFFNYFH